MVTIFRTVQCGQLLWSTRRCFVHVSHDVARPCLTLLGRHKRRGPQAAELGRRQPQGWHDFHTLNRG